MIASGLVAALKAFVSVFELLQYLIWSQFGLFLGGGYMTVQWS
jgi:hypothetical protein